MTLIKKRKVKKVIGTVNGDAFYVGTEVEDEFERWDDHWETVAGEWVIHEGKEHHVYVNKGHPLLRVEYHNVCPHCGAVNSIYPFFIGRKRMYVCSEDANGCGKATRGITMTEYRKRRQQ